MKRPAHIYDECWGANLWLLVPATEQTLDSFILQKYGVDVKTGDCDFVGRTVEVLDGDGAQVAVVIGLAGWKGSPRDHSTLAHEALHAATMILEKRGVSFNEDTEECYAYLMDSLFRRGLEHLNKGRTR